MSSLGEKILALHHCLDDASIPHALGGAISLAYAVEEARATSDIDINIFVPVERAAEILDLLPEGVAVGPTDRRAVSRDGQVRLWWDQTPVDLFFSTVEFHDVAEGRIVQVPFEQDTIPVLSGTDLAVCKAMFGRSKDWVDIESMRDAGSIDGVEAMRWVVAMIGAGHPSALRLGEVLAEPRAARADGDRLPEALRPAPGRSRGRTDP